MSWSRFDDLYDDHPKVLAAFHAHDLAVGLHAAAITASSRRESDGLVDPFWLIARVPDTRKRNGVLSALVKLRLYDLLPAGETRTLTDAKGFQVTIGPFDDGRYLVHDYLDFNPSSAQLQDKRRKEAERKANGRRAESASSPNGVRADIPRTPRGLPAREGAQRRPHPIPSHSQEPPLAPPADAGGEQGSPGQASPEAPKNSRPYGTNPRALAALAVASEATERASRAASILIEPTDEHRNEWLRLRKALASMVGTDTPTWGLYVEGLSLAAVAGDTLVIDGPDSSWGWHRAARTVELACERTSVNARLSSADEHSGLQCMNGAAA